MASKLIQIASHEVQNQIEYCLREAFEILEPTLRPSFSLTIHNQQEYLQLNQAILYGILCEPHFAKTHIKHLHAIINDGYCSFVKLLREVVNELYVKLTDTARVQLVWITKEMVDVSAVGIGDFLACLLRQIVGADFTDGNLCLCSAVVSIFQTKWDCLLEIEPMILTSALYTFLRLLADHCRLINNTKLEALKRLEIEFCVRVLREQFILCLEMGRELVRLLQDLVHVPEIRVIWKDLVLNPSEFKAAGFSDISQLYCTKTSNRYFLLRITPEMETNLRFLLTHVKLGTQKRHQTWFAKKFLCEPGRDTIISDIVRFICCAHHPPSEIIQSEIIPRWAVLGWLLKSCTKNYVEANVKLALFYDWLFFDEQIDNIMNIEPAMLLMVHSIPGYIDLTHTLLEFLFLLVDNYDVERKDLIAKGVFSSFSLLVQRGMVHSLDALVSCASLSPFLRGRLGKFMFDMKLDVCGNLNPVNLPPKPVLPMSLQNSSCFKSPTPSSEGQHICTQEDVSARDASVIISGQSGSSVQVDPLEKLIQNFGQSIKKPNEMGLDTLEELLSLYVNLDNNISTRCSAFPAYLSSKIANTYELNGYKLFAPLKFLQDNPNHDDEVGSPTALIIRSFMFSQHQRFQEMLFYWSRKGFPVGARLLSYATRLAYEAHIAGFAVDEIVSNKSTNGGDSVVPLSLFHFDAYLRSSNGKEDSQDMVDSNPEIDQKLISKLVDDAFSSYRCFLMYLKDPQVLLSKPFFSDLITCCEWGEKKLKYMLHGILCHLSDLSICEEEFIRLIVDQLDHKDLLDIQFEIGLKKFCLFGEKAETISSLIKNSLTWGSLEQHKLWGLIRSELAVSKIEVEKLLLKFFCCELEANTSSIAVGGFLSLCICHVPTPELVGAIMLLPNNVFQEFAAAVLTAWDVSACSMLFESVTKFLEKLDGKSGGLGISGSTGIMINHSAIVWILKYLNARGLNVVDYLSNLSTNVLCKE